MKANCLFFNHQTWRFSNTSF